MSRHSHILTCSRLSIDNGGVPVKVSKVVNIKRTDDPLDYGCPFTGKGHAGNTILTIHDMHFEVIQFGILEDVHIYIMECPDCHRLFGLRQLIGE